MQVLGFTSAALEDDDSFDSILANVSAAAVALPFTVDVDWADAMMGASLPTVLMNVASTAVIAITILSAPKTFQDNYPEWKRYFVTTIEFAKDHFERYAIDKKSAQLLGIEYALREFNEVLQ